MRKLWVGGSDTLRVARVAARIGRRRRPSPPACWNCRVTWSGLYWKAMMFVGTGLSASNTTSAPFRSRGLPVKSEGTRASEGGPIRGRSGHGIRRSTTCPSLVVTMISPVVRISVTTPPTFFSTIASAVGLALFAAPKVDTDRRT